MRADFAGGCARTRSGGASTLMPAAARKARRNPMSATASDTMTATRHHFGSRPMAEAYTG